MIFRHNYPAREKIDGNGYLFDETLFIPAYSYLVSRLIPIANYKSWSLHLYHPFSWSDWRIYIRVSNDAQTWFEIGNLFYSNTYTNTYVESGGFQENGWNYLQVILEVTNGGTVPHYNLVKIPRSCGETEA